MTKEIAVIEESTALAHLATVAAAAQEMRLLKFVKGKFYTGDDEVPIGREYVAHVNQLNHGWVKFSDNKVADQRIGAVAKGFVCVPREELGDTDTASWEKDGTGTPRDPWTRQYYLPLEDVESGELLTFVTGSQGGNTAVGRLASQFVRNSRNGLPIVRLNATSYKHKSFGRVETPDFPVIGWTGGEKKISTPAETAKEFNDAIPF
jgi:hypothetical protein